MLFPTYSFKGLLTNNPIQNVLKTWRKIIQQNNITMKRLHIHKSPPKIFFKMDQKLTSAAANAC